MSSWGSGSKISKLEGVGDFSFLGLKVIFKNLGRVGDFFWCNFEFDGTDGNQKCPLKFFILCRYIDKVYTYIYI